MQLTNEHTDPDMYLQQIINTDVNFAVENVTAFYLQLSSITAASM